MSFYRTRTVKAGRKAYRCEECGQTIAVGEAHLSSAMLIEGEFDTARHHADCSRWASAVMCCDDGRVWLRDGDPRDEDELDDAVRANPPPPPVYERLPTAWRRAVDEILGPGPRPEQGRLL